MANTANLAVVYVRERVATREYMRSTARTASYTLARFADHCPEDPEKIARRHVLRWFDSQERCVPSTVAARYGTVRSFVRWLNGTGRVRKDPTLGIDGPTRPRRAPRALDVEDIERLLRTAPDSRCRLAISLMVCEGLRISEVTGLQIADLDWRNLEVHVIGKGDKERFVHLTPATANAARSYLAEHPASSGWLIRSYRDEHAGVSSDRLGRVVTWHMAEQGVKHQARDGKSPHAFRHTYGSDLVDSGLTLPEVADLMGHESIQTTMQYQRRKNLRATRDVVVGRSYAAGLTAVPPSPIIDLR